MRKTEGERDSHKAKEGEEQALTTPLSYTGSPEELDAELGKHPTAYVDSHVQRGSNFGGSEDGNGNGAKEARQKPRTTQQPKTPDENGPKREATVAMATATEATPSLFAPQPPLVGKRNRYMAQNREGDCRVSRLAVDCSHTF